jgi:hypothetical protein
MDERAEIEAAMDRLLDGIPLRSDGKLTVVALAAEAGVKRHALTHKHTDLKDRFYARIKAQQSAPASEAALREQNADLCRKLGDMRAERDEYKHAADALARALNVLTIENDELRRKASRTGQPTGPRPLISLRRTARSFHLARLMAIRSRRCLRHESAESCSFKPGLSPGCAGLTPVTELSVHRWSHTSPSRPEMQVMTRNPHKSEGASRYATAPQHG